jgi:hypothetical protein
VIDLLDELTCAVCGCTDSHACAGGCWWVCEEPPICSACVAGTTVEDVVARIVIAEMDEAGAFGSMRVASA